MIDIIATDHAPHTRAEKALAYFDAPSGLPLVQHSLLMLLELYHRGHLTLAQIAEKSAHNPARLFRIKDRGFIREGYYADIAVVQLDAPTTVGQAELKYKCAWSPLEGTQFRSTVAMTLLGGDVVFDHGQIRDTGRGTELEFSA